VARTTRGREGELTRHEQVLTDDTAILDAIDSPTEHAIYALLLRATEPARWDRIVRAREDRIVRTAVSAPPSAVRRLARVGARAARWVLAVPSEPGLKTFSRHGDAVEGVVGALGSVEFGAADGCSLPVCVPVELGRGDGGGGRPVEMGTRSPGPVSEGAASWISAWPRRNLEGDVVLSRVRR
jgi:hypothetical protein